MHTLARIKTLFTIVALLGAALPAWAVDAPVAAVPAGLGAFLEGCLLEAGGQYLEASAKFAEAYAANPASSEVAVRYANVQFDLGRAEKAYELLATRTDLDWYGQRVRALALATLAMHDQNRLPAARDALRAVVEERTDDPNLMLTLVQVEHASGNLAAAEAVMSDLRSSRGGSPQLISYHANLLRDLGRLEDATELYEQCVDAPVVRSGCRQGMLDALVALDRYAEAGELLQGWAASDDLDDLLRAAALLSEGGRLGRALTVLQRVLAVEPESPRALTLEALLLAGVGRHQEAVVRFQKLMRKDPENLDLLLPLAWSQVRVGAIEEARTTIARAWEVVQEDAASPRATAVCLNAARVELAAERPLVARDWLDRVAAPGQAGPDHLRLLAETYRRSEQYREGVAAMLRLQPTLPSEMRPEAVAFEGEMRLRAGDPDGVATLRPLLASDRPLVVATAIQVLQATERWADVERESAAALARHPDDEILIFARAAALERLGRFDEAAAAFERLLQLDPDNDSAANFLGYMWADRGDNLDRALALITRAVDADPDNPAYLDSLGWVHFRRGDLANAIQWLRRAVDIGDGDGTVLGHLGEALVAAGQVEEGRGLLQRALDVGCEDEDHIRSLLESLEAGL